jgi:hypothetical protein
MLIKTVSELRETPLMPATQQRGDDRQGGGAHGQGAGWTGQDTATATRI